MAAAKEEALVAGDESAGSAFMMNFSDQVQGVAGHGIAARSPGKVPEAERLVSLPAARVDPLDSAMEAHTKALDGMAATLCHCCDRRRTPGHRWCIDHKRVYDSMVRDISSKKKIDPEAYKKEMAAHQLTTKDPAASARKVLAFERDSPAVIKGKKRGTFDHISFHETFCKKSYSSDESWGKHMDFIEYSRKMERKHGWSVGQSKAK